MTAVASSEARFQLMPLGGLALTNPLEAYAKEVEVICDQGANKYQITLEPSNQKASLERSLTGCIFQLKSFVAEKLADRPLDVALYTLSPESLVSNGNAVYSIFDLKNDKGEVLDRRLVSASVSGQEDPCPTGPCSLQSVMVQFSYSELMRSDVILENKIKIQEMNFSMASEPAPQCTVKAAFVEGAVAGKPGEVALKLTLSDCKNLSDAKTLELAVVHHRYNKVYQATAKAGDPANFVGLHEAITSFAKSASFATSATFELKLSLDEIKKITGKRTVAAALREDFVLAIRNKGGKSIRYFVIDNTCTSDLVDLMQDKLAAAKAQTWTVLQPGAGNKAYFAIHGLNLDAKVDSEVYHGFCIDTDRNITLNYKYTGSVYSSYDLDEIYRLGLVERPSAMPAVNWLLNTYLDSGKYTYGELQKAIWNLLDNEVVNNGLGTVDQAKVNSLVTEARAKGMNYVPSKAKDYMAVVLVPLENDVIKQQITIAVTKLPELCTPTNDDCPK